MRLPRICVSVVAFRIWAMENCSSCSCRSLGTYIWVWDAWGQFHSRNFTCVEHERHDELVRASRPKPPSHLEPLGAPVNECGSYIDHMCQLHTGVSKRLNFLYFDVTDVTTTITPRGGPRDPPLTWTITSRGGSDPPP